jgi:AcrR family transcriptional regulator
MKKKSKDDWLHAALDLLEEQGIHSITIINLAKKLKIARSGFYWHFKDRENLLAELLAYWTREYTEVFSTNPEIINTEPVKRLNLIAEGVFDYQLAKYDLQFRMWANEDPVVSKEVNRVYKTRLDFLRKTFAELGFEGLDLEMRTHLFVCYTSWEQIMFWKESKSNLKKMIESRIKLLVKK